MPPTFGQRKEQFGCRASHGQATVEYILLLVIVLALFLGPLNQFSKFISGFTEALFGEGQYIACLLETGDLPGEVAGAANDSCAAAFSAAVKSAAAQNPIDDPNSANANQNANQNAGGNANSNANGSGSDDSSSGGNSSADSGQGGGPNARKSKSSPRSSSSGRGASDGGGSGETAPDGLGAAALNRSGRPSAETANGAKAGGAAASEAASGEDLKFQQMKSKETMLLNKDGLNRNFNLQDDDNRRAEKLSPKTIAVTNISHLKAKEFSFEAQRAPATKTDEGDDEGFSFSRIMKWLLIVGIIVALVVFVGGQIFQISKSGES